MLDIKQVTETVASRLRQKSSRSGSYHSAGSPLLRYISQIVEKAAEKSLQ